MSSVRFKAGIIIASTFHLKQHRTPQKCRKMQNKGIYTDISRNTIAIRDKSARNNPECRNRSSGNNQPQRIPRGLYHDITPEQPEPTAEPRRPNQPEPIPPNRSSLSRSARAGFFAALRSGDCTAGSMLFYCHARKCFLRFFCAEFCKTKTGAAMPRLDFRFPSFCACS